MRRMTLTPVHFVVVASTLVSVLAVTWILFEQPLRQLYLQEVLIPRLEDSYGFRGGPVSFKRDNTTFDQWGFVKLMPDSPLAALGLRPRDVPAAYHDGLAAMYYALRDARREEFAAFEVINADDWNAGHRNAIRTIIAYPPGTDLPLHFRQPDGQELMSPTAQFGLLAVEQAPGRYDLVLRHYASAEALGVYSYQTHVAAVWATSGDWIALTDHDNVRTPRCIVVNTRTGERIDISDLAARFAAFDRDSRVGEERACEVFGWVRGTSRAAVMLWNSERRVPAFGSYFLDTATWTFTDARAQ